MSVILLQIKALLMHRAVGIVQAPRKLSQPGQANAVPDVQNKGWVGHCACVVEVGFATQHWSGKLEGLSTA